MGIIASNTFCLSSKTLNTIEEMSKNSKIIVETSFISDTDIISNIDDCNGSTEKLI